MEERYELIKARIYEIPGETEDEFFAGTAGFLGKVIRYYEEERAGAYDGYDLSERKDLQDELYAPLLPDRYKDTFLFPPKAKECFGTELGALYSALLADLMATIGYAVRDEREKLLIFLELFVEIYGIASCSEDEEEYIRDVKNSIGAFYHDYAEIFVRDSIEGTVLPGEGAVRNILSEAADLSDVRYLFRYGTYIGKNEIDTASYLASLPEEDIKAMAATFVEGYVKGFEVTGRDISKKNTVKVEYPIGFERMARAAVDMFKEKGLSATFTFEAALSFTGRGGPKRGVYATSCNRDFDFDHSDDFGLYMDRRLVARKLELLGEIYEEHKGAARAFGGPAVIEIFGESRFTPTPLNKNYKYTAKQEKINLGYASKSGEITNRYIPGDERSFTIIAYPISEIGKDFEAIFNETVRINTLDYEMYRDIQQIMIDALDEGEYVRVEGAEGNETDMTVMLHPLSDPAKETNFENCVADVNIPVGEVFTSPVLEGTHGVLNVSHAYLGEYEYHDLKLSFEDGRIKDYSCSDFGDEAMEKAFIKDNILHHHETLPIGEFAIGTNTHAYRMARQYDIENMLPILIMEKTGPHFAVGDTCYSHAEDVPMKNPDGKECIARDNSCSLKRRSKDEEERAKAYFNCHTDITIPFSELKAIYVVKKDSTTTDIIRDGRFVLPGCEQLNEPLEREEQR